MSLIEQLGGYEKAKEKRDDISHTLDNSELLGGGDAREGLYERLESIDKALLEYRRQHNIFEVGDKVVYRALPHERLFSVRFVGDDEIVVYELWDEMGAKTFTEKHPYSDIDHAIPEEIAAGKRLEVK